MSGLKFVLIGVTAAAAFFAAAAVTMTHAMFPPRHQVAAVCPCISHVTCRDVTVEGDQSGWFFVPDRPNGGAILMLHGIGATREDMLGIGNVFLRAGYSILVPDLRGFGRSAGGVTFGVRDSRDAAAWAEWLRIQRGVERLYGFGVSLGGSSLLESLDYEKGFRAVVAESSFSDFPAIAKERMRRQMPAGLGWATTPFVKSGLLWARLRYGANMWRPSAVESVRRSRTPALIIHGLADGETLPENSRRIAAANPQTTQLWLIPNAHHADAWATAGKVFESRVLTWYASH